MGSWHYIVTGSNQKVYFGVIFWRLVYTTTACSLPWALHFGYKMAFKLIAFGSGISLGLIGYEALISRILHSEYAACQRLVAFV